MSADVFRFDGAPTGQPLLLPVKHVRALSEPDDPASLFEVATYRRIGRARGRWLYQLEER